MAEPRQKSACKSSGSNSTQVTVVCGPERNCESVLLAAAETKWDLEYALSVFRPSTKIWLKKYRINLVFQVITTVLAIHAVDTATLLHWNWHCQKLHWSLTLKTTFPSSQGRNPKLYFFASRLLEPKWTWPSFLYIKPWRINVSLFAHCTHRIPPNINLFYSVYERTYGRNMQKRIFVTSSTRVRCYPKLKIIP